MSAALAILALAAALLAPAEPAARDDAPATGRTEAAGVAGASDPTRPPSAAELALAAARSALALPGASVEVLGVGGALPPGCAPAGAEIPRPVEASGQAPLRLTGRTATGAECSTWAWARVRVTAPAIVTTRALAAGARLAGATALAPREVLAGRPRLAELPDGAVAERALPAGAVLDPAHVRSGPAPGEPVAVVLQAGAIAVEQTGRAVSCRRGRACALLPSGARVEGAWHGGRIVLDSP